MSATDLDLDVMSLLRRDMHATFEAFESVIETIDTG